MLPDEARSGLPPIYRHVLEYLDAGLSRDEIATRVGVDRHAVDPLIGLARAKLDRLRHERAVATRLPEEQP